MAELTDTEIRDRVRERYAAAATAAATDIDSGCCGGQRLCGLRPRHGPDRQAGHRGLRRQPLRR